MLILLSRLALGQDEVTQDYTLDIERFRPGQDAYGYGVGESAATLKPLQVGVGLWGNYSEDSVVLVDDGVRILGDGREDGDGILDNRSVADLQVGIGLTRFFSLTVGAPVVLWQQGYEPSSADNPLQDSELLASGLMDVRVAPKFVIVDIDEYPVGLAVAPKFTLPAGQPRSFLGEAGFTASPTLYFELADAPVHTREYRIRFAANAAYHLREKGRFRDLLLNDEFVYSASLGLHPSPPVEFGVEAVGAVGGPRTVQSPLEVLPYLKLHPLDIVTLTAGGGFGLLPGIGAPDYRVWGGATLAPSFNPADKDTDKDGIPNSVDACRYDPEDLDRFEDEDGCPDNDNDKDGLLDPDDQCPDDPEDHDGFHDDDGCPDPDNDRDGFLDVRDACPDDAETFNQFEDEDGCPDERPPDDTDGDGFLDPDDACPRAPEDFDGYQDDDGCPEADNDQDRIPDIMDGCPLVPENYNGVADEDGCPDDDKPQRVIVEKTRIKITETIYFDYNKASIRKDSYGLLDEIAAVIIDHPDILQIRVEGHTDADGDEEYNLKLSQARAESVRNYLIAAGVEADRMHAMGFGEGRPLVENDNDTNKQVNRRVEFIIVEQH